MAQNDSWSALWALGHGGERRQKESMTCPVVPGGALLALDRKPSVWCQELSGKDLVSRRDFWGHGEVEQVCGALAALVDTQDLLPRARSRAMRELNWDGRAC